MMEMCIAMIMVMSSYFSIGKGFIIHHDNHGGIGDINGDTVYILLLDRTRLHQVDGGYDGGGYVYGDD